MNRKLVQKAEALLAKERGTVYKDPGGRISICLVFPNTYSVGMSNLGFQGIYGMLNRRDDIVCERAFLPEESDIREYRRTGTPLFSFESKRPLAEFDIVAFSLSFENDYPNIITILDLARIPPEAAERNRFHPLVIAGGVCCFFNPEPFVPAFDIIVSGEAEGLIDEFIELYKERDGVKDAVKKGASGVEGLYVPEFYEIRYNDDGTIRERLPLEGAPDRIRTRRLKDLSSSPITTSIITPEAEFSDMYLMEAMRGCPWRCRFCLVGHIYGPVRKKGIEQLRADVERARESAAGSQQQAVRIGVIGPSLTDHPDIEDLLCMEGVEFSITSLRASEKSAAIVDLLKRHKSVSIAPEAGTERMRQVVRKRVTEEEILRTSELILDGGIENLRLYFMIGLPSERHEDIEGIVDLVKKVRQISGKGSIILSVSTFVPKPFTPFQWHPMEELNRVKEKLKFIKSSLKTERGVKVFHDVPKYAHMQGLFSVGDRRVFPVLRAMAQAGDFKRALAETGVEMGQYVFRQKGVEEILPWDFLDHGGSKARLWEDYRQALSLS
ncbi:MAG: radical SAM protein [Thermodesulfovibrionales bacterium]|jgi:radical SAM superfamily enzyme YgiQ (UPF0313 family)